jgi:hypothetical protein
MHGHIFALTAFDSATTNVGVERLSEPHDHSNDMNNTTLPIKAALRGVITALEAMYAVLANHAAGDLPVVLKKTEAAKSPEELPTSYVTYGHEDESIDIDRWLRE